jgi:uroporphyrinogen decarboxylase
LTHRERVLAALKHQPPDRVPLDLGSTICSSITAKAHARLRAYLGIPAEPLPIIVDKVQSLVDPDEAILRRFDVDLRSLLLGSADKQPEGQRSDDAFVDEWGVTWTRHGESHYINTNGPFCSLAEPTVQDLAEFSWPDPGDPGRYRGLRQRAQNLHEKTDYAVVLTFGGGPVHQSQYMRGFGAWLEDLLVSPAFAEGLMDRYVEVWVEMIRLALQEAGEFIDVVMWGDDIGAQSTPLINPQLYRRAIKPRHRRINDALRRFGKPVLFHTCGAVFSLIPDLIESGIDALNPIQVSAVGMDTKRLKREFGRDLAFWGAIDTQQVLPRGTPAEVREEVKCRIGDLAEDGGYIVASVHNIQPEVPPENIEAMCEATLEFGR